MKNLTRETFLDHVRKSQIPSVERLDEWLAQNAATDPAQLASAMVRDGLLTRWQAKYLLSGRHVLMIDNYQLLERIRRDEWGDLFLAEQCQLSRKVQVRFLPASISQDEAVRNRFLERVRKTAQLDHPNIVHVMDVDQHKGRFFLVTEHVDATAAGEYSFDGAALARLVAQAIDALRFIHNAGIHHGAVDENSLLITRDGELKLNHLVTLTPTADDSSGETADDYKMLAATAIRIGRQIEDDPSAVAVVNWLQKYLDGEIDVATLRDEMNRMATASQQATDELVLEPVFDRPPEAQRPSPAGSPSGKNRDKTEPMRPAPKKLPGVVKRVNPIALVTGIVVVSLILLAFTIYAATTFLSPQVAQDADANPNKEKPRAASVRPKPPKPELMGGKLDDLDPNQPIQELVDKIPAKPAEDMPIPPADPQAAAPQTAANVAVAGEDTPAGDVTGDNASNETATLGDVAATAGEGSADQPANPVESDDSPPAGMADRTGAVPANQSNAANQSAEPQETVAAAPVSLADLPATVDLPPSEDTADIIIGSIPDNGNHLLGMELISGPEIARGNVAFELEPDHADGMRRWKVVYRRRESDPPIVVGEFVLEQQKLRFHWTAAAGEERNSDYLRNTIVRTVLGDDSHEIGLRSPVTIEGLVLPSDRPEARVDVPLEFLPDIDALTIELGELPEDEFGPVVIDDTVITRKKPAKVFFSAVDYEQMLGIQVSADVRNRIRLNAGAYIQIVPGERPVLAKAKDREQALNLLIQMAQKMKIEYQQFRAARTDDIRQRLLAEKRIRDGSEFTYELKRSIEDKMKTDSELAEERANQFKTQVMEYLPKWLDRPIPIVISFKLGDRTVVLARTPETAPAVANDDVPPDDKN